MNIKQGELLTLIKSDSYVGDVIITNFDVGTEQEEVYSIQKIQSYLVGDYIYIDRFGLLTKIRICEYQEIPRKQHGRMVTIFLQKKKRLQTVLAVPQTFLNTNNKP